VTVNIGYSTGSVKGVSQTDDPTNAALSTDLHQNWILADPGSRVTYDLAVSNDTDSAMTKLVLIDNLPGVGDHSPFNQSVPRGSAFGVTLADAPNFRVRIQPKEGESYLLPEEFWRVEYTADTDFGQAQSNDWKGEDDTTANWVPAGEWTESLADVKAVRILIEDPDGTQIPSKATVTASFEARTDAGAEPGTIAWNNFGYHYALQGVLAQMEAMPLSVGVRIPEQPTLQKVLVDDNGPAEARQDESFSFLLYAGEPVSAESDEALLESLDAAGRAYTQVDVTVKAGETASEAVSLDWQWQEGRVYTLTELQPRRGISPEGFEDSGENVYRFVYDPLDDLQILCQNRILEWQIRLTKQDKPGEEGTPLAGAVFGLYSPDPEDQLDEAGGFLLTVEEGGQIWYLTALGTIDQQGQIFFDGLIREHYYLRELQAPAGHHPNWFGEVIERKNATDGEYTLEVVNDPGVVLPRTGGMGTELFRLLGIALMGVALVSGLIFLRRRKVR
jgi:LPXTG-motif cell wall-anchored protein